MKKTLAVLIGACAAFSAHAQSATTTDDSLMANTSLVTTAVVVAAPLALLTVVIATAEDNDAPSVPSATVSTTSTR